MRKTIRKTLFRTGVEVLLCALVGLAGCGDSKTKKTGEGNGAHPSKGPHGGSLVELGNEAYHAEVVHDEDAGTLTIYILDGAAKKVVPIEAKELTVNVTHDGKPEQFKIAASPDQGDPSGMSSRFISKDKELLKDIDAEGVVAHLVVMISGKSYRGKFAHDHDGE